jgi:hypothetical protein
LTYQQGAPAAGGNAAEVVDFYPTGSWARATAIQVVAGQRYCFSAYALAHRCDVGVCFQFFDANDNATTGLINSGPIGTSESFADALTSYVRPAVFWVAPAGSALCRVAIRKYNTRAGQSESYIWMAAPQLEAVSANVTTPSAYQPGPASNTRQLGYNGDLAATRNDVYRQATDPGAVPNGSIWLNTTTGRAQQRVAGAWQPYVGPSSVNTGELALGATVEEGRHWATGPFTSVGNVLTFVVNPSADGVLKMTVNVDGTILTTTFS